MQQQPQMIPMMPTSFPPTSITTEQIQKYLDENKKLIMAILDNQNLGKLAECAQYQAQLQKNLMYLAAIADAQPQPPTMPHQMSPHPVMQQGAYFMQHPQVAMAQQSGVLPQRVAMQFNQMQDPQQQQQLHQQHHVFQGARPGTMHHPEAAHGGTKQDAPEAGPNDGQESSAAAPGGGDGESYLKGSEEVK